MENKISITISPEVENAILEAILSIEAKLPMLINLSLEDRHNIPKLGDKTLAFVTKSLEYAKQNPAIVPTFLDVAEFEKDVNAMIAIDRILKPTRQLLEKMDDTTMLAGSEAYSAALIFYGSLKGASKANVPGMKSVYEDLQARFPGRAKSSGKKNSKPKENNSSTDTPEQ